MKTNIRVNNTTQELSLDSRLTLLDALRDVLGLFGTKKGCDQGACGACTVIIDGQRVLSCLTLAAACEGQHVLFVGQPDAMTPLGTKGIGELAITGMTAAIANAVYHATGTRVRSLPICIEKMLGHESSSPRTSSLLDAIAGRAGRGSNAP